MDSGIYKITNLINNKIYIGSTVNLKNREYVHFYELKNNKHINPHLQHSFNKYGIDNFKFEILATCPKEYLIKLEQWFLDTQNPELNIYKKAYSPLGYKHKQETKDKLSNLKKGKSRPKWIIDKLKEINTGRKFTKDHKNKLKEAYSKREFKGNRTVLDEVKVKEIKLLLREGKSLSFIGKLYNISSPMISRIKNNIAWKEVSIDGL